MTKTLSTLFFLLFINFSHADHCYAPSELNNKVHTLTGTWENPSSGITLNFYHVQNQLILARYQFTPISLILEQTPFSLSENDLESIQVSKDNNLILNDQIFYKIDQLPPSSSTIPGTPLENFDVFSETFKQFYAFFDQRNIDWPAITNQYRSKISQNTSDEELFEIFKQMISPLKDNHIALAKGFDEDSEKYFQFNLPPFFEKQLIQDQSLILENSNLDLSDYIDLITQEAIPVILENYLTDPHQDLYKKIIWGKLSHNTTIGYLNILSMEYDPAELEHILDEIINYFNENKISALIFDLRFNQGGSEEISASFAKRFADTTHLILTKQEYYNGLLTPKRPLFIKPENKQIWDPMIPKILLTSPVTASAAEGFVLALSTFPNLTRIGASTMGILSDQFARKLPNGWWITLSNELILNPEGKSYEIIGIPPHIHADFPFIKYSSVKLDPSLKIAVDIFNKKMLN